MRADAATVAGLTSLQLLTLVHPVLVAVDTAEGDDSFQRLLVQNFVEMAVSNGWCLQGRVNRTFQVWRAALLFLAEARRPHVCAADATESSAGTRGTAAATVSMWQSPPRAHAPA